MADDTPPWESIPGMSPLPSEKTPPWVSLQGLTPTRTPRVMDDATAAPPPEVADPNAPGKLESLWRGAADSATFGVANQQGWTDKDRDEASRKANPWTHFFGEALGTVPLMLGAAAVPEIAVPAAYGRVAVGTGRAANLARSALVPGEMETLGQTIGQTAKLGATYGGLSGAGHADVQPDDTLEDALKKRAQGAAIGAAEGVVTSPLVGGITHGAVRTIQGIRQPLAEAAAEGVPGGTGAARRYLNVTGQDRITPDDLITQIRNEHMDAVGRTPSPTWGDPANPQAWDADTVEDILRASMAGHAPADIATHMQGTHPGITAQQVQDLSHGLADQYLAPLNLVDRAGLVRPGAGRKTQMSMRAAIASPGESQAVASENLMHRQLGAGDRIGGLLEDTLGSRDLEGVQAAHQRMMETAVGQAYDLAHANEQPFDLQPILDRYRQRYQGKSSDIARTVIGQLDGMSSREPVVRAATGQQPLGANWLPPVPDNGSLATGTGLHNLVAPQNIEDFMLARSGLRDTMQKATQNGEHNKARILRGLYDDISDHVAETNPDWKVANDLARDGAAGREALEAGMETGTRLNAGTRANLREFEIAQRDGLVAQGDFTRANDNLRQYIASGAADPAQEQALHNEIARSQARLTAAVARQGLFRVGMVRKYMDDIVNPDTGTIDLSRKMLSRGARQIYRTVLGDADANRFIRGLEQEAQIHRTYASQYGAQTTPLAEAIKEQNIGGEAVEISHNPLHWAGKAISLAHRWAASHINGQRNTALTNLYMEQGRLRQLEILRALQNLQQVRANTTHAVGQPLIGAYGAGTAAYVGEHPESRGGSAIPPYNPGP